MQRKELIDIIEKIKPGTVNNPLLDQTKFVLLDGKNIMSYNDDIAITIPFEIGIKGGIPANKLLALLKKMEGDNIEIINEEGELRLKCGQTRAGFNIFDDIVIPNIGINDIEKWHKLPEDFWQAIEFCMFSSSNDINDGILICLKAEDNFVLACDNYRATKYFLTGKLSQGNTLLIPKKSAKFLIQHGFTHFNIGPNWTHFKGEMSGTIYSCRKFDGEYPNVEKLLDVKGDNVELPNGLQKILDRVEILADTDEEIGNKMIDIAIEDGKITCFGYSDEGWIEESPAIEYDGKPIHIIVDPRMLRQILDHVNVTTISENKMLFVGDNFKHMVPLAE